MIRAVPCVWFAYVFVVVAFFDSCVMVNIGRHTSICTTRIAFFRRAKYIVVDPPRVRFSGLAIVGKYPDTLFSHYLSLSISLSFLLSSNNYAHCSKRLTSSSIQTTLPLSLSLSFCFSRQRTTTTSRICQCARRPEPPLMRL